MIQKNKNKKKTNEEFANVPDKEKFIQEELDTLMWNIRNFNIIVINSICFHKQIF